MIDVIEPKYFKTIPWKNGLGETTELAINDGSSIDCFDWRLSIASVTNNGVFSDFTGYHRNLILIAGQGLTLKHDNGTCDKLVKLLDMASFDGACETFGELTTGDIKDFNIITNKQKIAPQVNCYVEATSISVKLAPSALYFAYSLTGEINAVLNSQEKIIVPQGHLLKISPFEDAANKHANNATLKGENMILIQLITREVVTL